jgi:hypothetical protein
MQITRGWRFVDGAVASGAFRFDGIGSAHQIFISSRF